MGASGSIATSPDMNKGPYGPVKTPVAIARTSAHVRTELERCGTVIRENNTRAA